MYILSIYARHVLEHLDNRVLAAKNSCSCFLYSNE